ncbi:hypothetical protein LINPERPRIM_LOCUS1520 [Linum perenne]
MIFIGHIVPPGTSTYRTYMQITDKTSTPRFGTLLYLLAVCCLLQSFTCSRGLVAVLFFQRDLEGLSAMKRCLLSTVRKWLHIVDNKLLKQGSEK